MPKVKKTSNHAHTCMRKTEIDYFSTPPIQKSIEREFFQDVTAEEFTSSSPVQWHIASSPQEYIDLAKTYVTIVIRVTKSDGGDINDDSNQTGKLLSISNNIFHTLWSSVDMSINGTHITRYHL